ncbi:MAG: DUF599 domain-containing protein [Pseudomonadota bacterium]
MDDMTAWLLIAASAVLLAAYEAWAVWVGARQPERVARSRHARMRVDWVRALARQPGFEIVAVQTLRNSLMSATIAASTAALALMGSMSLAAPRLAQGLDAAHPLAGLTPRTALEICLMLVLFASYVCSAMAMRFFNHAGFVMSMPAGAAEREPLMPMAEDYVERAGLLYSWGLRCFLAVAPLVAGIVSPLAMLPMTVVLLVVLRFFDRPAKPAAG